MSVRRDGIKDGTYSLQRHVAQRLTKVEYKVRGRGSIRVFENQA